MVSIWGILNSGLSIPAIIQVFSAVVICLSVHEFSHALMADRLGDDTARLMGRLTINPMMHLDLLGTLCMLIAGFGWAKPVPFNPNRLKKPRRDTILIAAAGPISNILLAFFAFTIWLLLILYGRGSSWATSLSSFMNTTGTLSVGFAIFNLLPLPPLDGSKLIIPLLPQKAVMVVYRYERYAQLILLALIMLGALDGVLYTLRAAVTNALFSAILLIFSLFGV